MKNITPKTILNLSLKLGVILFAIITVAGAANAATITVTNTNDSGAGSLRQALADASNGDTIDFAVTGAITLTTASLTVEKDVTISGPGADKLAVQRSADAGTPGFRIFSIGSISSVTIRTVTISGLTITNGAAAFGGGILNLGILTLTNSTVSGNRSDPSGGAGIANANTMILNNSTVSDNSAAVGGGGIYTFGESLSINNSTISGNSATGGGGIYSPNARVILKNSTITGNSASTVAGGGIYNPAGPVNVANTIIAGNTSGIGPDVAGNVTSKGYNLIGNASGSTGFSAVGDQTGTIASPIDPKLGPLADNGGPTFTHALLPGSPAIDAGSNALAVDGSGNPLTTDQRGTGFLRTFGGMVDIGAFEVQPITSPCTNLNFAPAANFKVGQTPYSVTAGDFDGDGNLDLVTANSQSDNVSVLLGNGSGGFAPKTNFTVGDNPFSVAAGDLNGDGKLDLVSANADSDNVSVLLGNGLGGFAPATNFSVGASPVSVTIGDFNHDGKPDLAVANANSINVSVLLGDGLGGFAPKTNFNAGSRPFSVTTGDFNADGNTDLAASNAGSNDVSVLLGDGLGGFAPAMNFPVGSLDPDSLTIGDFNGDGKLDLATANFVSNTGSVLLGDGSGGFALAMNFTGGDGMYSVTAGDFNGDGKLDLAAGNSGDNNVSVLLGDGSGGFAPATNFAVGKIPVSVTIGDFNGDGKLDIASANAGIDSNNVSILLNGCSSNTAPVANNDGYSTNEDTPLIVAAPGVLGNDTDSNSGDTLTAALVSGPSHAASFSLNPDGSFSYTPAANFNGTDTFTYKANDGSLDSNVATVTITVNPVNDAPVADADAYSTNEDTPLTVPAPGVLGNDSDADSDTLTVGVYSQPLHGTLTLDADGSFIYTPAANYNGADSFTYRANDGTVNSNVATVRITIRPVNDAPMVSAAPKTQSSVQYSDAIQPVTVSASDLETPASALAIAFSYTKDGGALQPGLPAGMVQGGTAGAWTVSGVAGVPQGTYVITASVTDTGDNGAAAKTSADSFTIVVTRENAVASPRSSNPVSMQVASAGGTATGTTAEICFDITEPSDGSAGNTSFIDSATVLINAVGGGSGAGTITPSAVTFSGGGVGQARTACFTLTLTNTPANVYEIELVVGGNYYTGSGTTAFTVFDPSAGFASGGGWIINPNTGYRANYGVTVKYLKNGNAQGSLLYVEHRPDGDYKVKSTSLNSKGGFAILPITGGAEADIAGKANFGVNDVFTGNYSFIARVIDKGTPGTNDEFGLKLVNPSGQVVSDLTFTPQTLGGGNNQVPKK